MKLLLKSMSMLLAFCMVLSALIPAFVFAEDEVDFDSVDVFACDNTYVNTGNQRQDLLNVALTQLGYTEGECNDTKYGTWYGMPFQAWCATFVTWCARQAEISTDILGRSALASPKRGYFNIPYYDGAKYTPKPGDLFFYKNFSHVGIVYYTEGEYFYCIEGNANPEHSVDGFWVIINKRKISDYYFGVPPYEGGDKDHSYARGVESGHPHKVYYKCSDCGDKYYTGYTEFKEGCSACLSCGCTASGAGYYRYLSNQNYPRLAIRAEHSTGSAEVGGISNGASVKVLGTGSGGWAYVEYYGTRGHVQMKNLTKYYGPPKSPKISTDRQEYIWDDNVVISWTEAANAEKYYLEILRNGEQIVNESMGLIRDYTIKNAKVGTYEVRVQAANLSGRSDVAVHTFQVQDTYHVSFDPRGGSGAPESMTQVLGRAVTLPETQPSREGHVFLGWTEEQTGNFAVYKPGSSLVGDGDMTLYAVWKDENAAAQTLEISKLPNRTMFLQEEELDTAGMELSVYYSDGSGHAVTDGYTLEGFSSAELGNVTVSVLCEGLTAQFDVQIVSYIPGDIDLNKSVNRDDVMALLWHISFPDRFPIGTPADFTGDNVVNRDDVMQLLWHISFPDRFPLILEEPSEPGV